MKILIPSNDCLTIAPNFDNAKTFRLLTIINGSVKEDSFITSSVDLRKKYPFGLKELGDSTTLEVNIPDVLILKNKNKLNLQIAIIIGISADAEKKLQKISYEVFHTKETNIINAVTSYLKNQGKMESDYCCYP
jgi:predicted Fe-Mo cluster-binding NifX family protein